jgi:hypothetical protein
VPGTVETAAESDQDRVHLERRPGLELERSPGAGANHPGNRCPHPDLDALGFECLAGRGARFGLFGREEAVGRLDDRHPDTKAGEDLGELAADRPAAEHGQPAGKLEC